MLNLGFLCAVWSCNDESDFVCLCAESEDEDLSLVYTLNCYRQGTGGCSCSKGRSKSSHQCIVLVHLPDPKNIPAPAISSWVSHRDTHSKNIRTSSSWAKSWENGNNTICGTAWSFANDRSIRSFYSEADLGSFGSDTICINYGGHISLKDDWIWSKRISSCETQS